MLALAAVRSVGRGECERPDRFWDVVMGPGYRATVDALTPQQRDHVRGRLLAELHDRDVRAVRTHVVFGTATR